MVSKTNTNTVKPLQGEIWLFDPDPIIGNEIGKKVRPCLIISNNHLNAGFAGIVLIIPLTSVFKGIPSHVQIEPPDGGLSVTSFALCEHIRSISKERLKKRLGIIKSPAILKKVQSWVQNLIRLD